MQTESLPAVHSADVQLSLNVAGRELPLSHVEPGCVILRTQIDLPPQDAEVIVTVDGRIHRRAVFLPNGISADQEIVPVVTSHDAVSAH
jgi:hypothetical protein